MSEFANRHVLSTGASSGVGLATARLLARRGGMFPEMEIDKRCPRVVAWIERMRTRPAVKRALAGEDRTAPKLPTWSGAR
jgi:NADP-dependent 3-hydroxy acid dehydrogenase YdfG